MCQQIGHRSNECGILNMTYLMLHSFPAVTWMSEANESIDSEKERRNLVINEHSLTTPVSDVKRARMW